MNIFYLHESPEECAKLHCDKHVVKMVIEYAQLMSTAHRMLDGEEYTALSKTGRKVTRWRLAENDDLIYKACHMNHPSTVWTRSSRDNYMYVYNLWYHLSHEYTHRYGKQHLTYQKLVEALSEPPENIPNTGFTQPPPAMKHFPQCIVTGDSIASYQKYYTVAKAHFARWTKREVPEFMVSAYS